MNFNQLDDLLNLKVEVVVLYIETDGRTLLHKNSLKGTIIEVHPENGVAVKADDAEKGIIALPPALEACQPNIDGSIQINWSVFRTQEKRIDGEHEWWDWRPGLTDTISAN